MELRVLEHRIKKTNDMQSRKATIIAKERKEEKRIAKEMKKREENIQDKKE